MSKNMIGMAATKTGIPDDLNPMPIPPKASTIEEMELDIRQEIFKLSSLFKKPFTMSQIGKTLFEGNKQQCKLYVDNLITVGAISTVNMDGNLKYSITGSIDKRKELIGKNIRELKEYLGSIQTQLQSLEQLYDNINKI